MTNGNTEQGLLSEALSRFRTRDWAEAERLLRACIDEFPSSDPAYHLLGLVYFEQGNTTLARKWIDQAIARNGDNQQYFNNLALVLSADGNDEAALAAANQAAHLAPDNPDTQTTRGVMLQKLGLREEATAAYRVVLGLKPDHESALINAALLHLEADEIGKAISHFRRALDVNPDSCDAVVGLGRCFAKNGELDDAVKILEEGQSYHNQSSKISMALADIYLQRQDPTKAISTLKAAADRFPDNPAIWNNLGYAWRDIPNSEKAIEALRRALTLNPDYDPAADNLGQVFLSRGNFKDGWPLHRRRKVSNLLRQQIGFVDPRNRPLSFPIEKPLVVWTEQGIGDEILQAGLINDLSKRSAQLSVICSERAKRIFKASFPQINVLSRDEGNQGLNDQGILFSPLIDMAELLRPSISSFPDHRGYLEPGKNKIADLRRRYLAGRSPDTLLVGISWRSANKLFGNANTIPLIEWAPIFQKVMEGEKPVAFVANQFGPIGEEFNQAAQIRDGVFILDDRVDVGGDLEDAIAQVAAMDLIVSTSTTTAQIGGALGKPTIHLTANGLACGWYWMQEGPTTPWYPGMTMVRRDTDKATQIRDAAEVVCKQIGLLEPAH